MQRQSAALGWGIWKSTPCRCPRCGDRANPAACVSATLDRLNVGLHAVHRRRPTGRHPEGPCGWDESNSVMSYSGGTGNCARLAASSNQAVGLDAAIAEQPLLQDGITCAPNRRTSVGDRRRFCDRRATHRQSLVQASASAMPRRPRASPPSRQTTTSRPTTLVAPHCPAHAHVAAGSAREFFRQFELDRASSHQVRNAQSCTASRFERPLVLTAAI